MGLDNFQLSARWSAKPQASAVASLPALVPSVAIEEAIEQFFTLDAKNHSQYQLAIDTPAQQVSFGGVVNAHIVKVTSDQPITVQFTSAQGILQQMPCDGLIIVISQAKPISSIALQRTPGLLTNVSVFVGEIAAAT